MKKIYLIAIAAALTNHIAAQTPSDITGKLEDTAKTVATVTSPDATTNVSAWQRSGNASINISQAAFSDWNAGGDPSLAIDAAFNYSINYKAGKNLWLNRLELACGINRTNSNGTRKTNDKIYLSSNYGYLLVPKLYASAIATFNTQFDKGYNYTVSSTDYISRFLAPGYLSAGLGLTYTPKTWLTVVLSPATWRGTFVHDKKLSDIGAFGVAPGKKLLNEFGAHLRVEVNTPLWQRLSLYSRLEFYANYLRNPQNVDVNWDIQLNYALTGWLTANLQVNLIYDDDIKFGQTATNPGYAHLQVKEVLGIGFQVKF